MTDDSHDVASGGPEGPNDALLHQLVDLNPVHSADFANWADYDTAMAACDAIVHQDQKAQSLRARLVGLRPASTFRMTLAACAAAVAIPVIAVLASSPAEITEDEGIGPASGQAPAGGPQGSTLGVPPTTIDAAPESTTSLDPTNNEIVGDADGSDQTDEDETVMSATSAPNSNETESDNGSNDDASSKDSSSINNDSGTSSESSNEDKTDPASTKAEPNQSAGNDDSDQSAVVQCGVISIEPELLNLVGDWKSVKDPTASGGKYITWEGMEPGESNGKPDDILNMQFSVEKAGLYRFTWAMRQPEVVKSSHADDSWINFPDANRFGPAAGDDFGGFIKVQGRAEETFDFVANGFWNGEKTDIAVVFNKPGYYTMQLGGRSHQHQIDRLVLHHRSVKQTDAVVSPCTTRPAPRSILTVENADFDPAQDLVSLHFDNAPAAEDLHAAAAARELVTRYGLNAVVANGAHGLNADQYSAASEPMMDKIWGPDAWIDANGDRNAAVRSVGVDWKKTVAAGGDVWVIEAGPSDLTSAVTRWLQKALPDIDTSKRVHVVHASGWNQRQTTPSELTFIKENTDFMTVADGNTGDNSTADLNSKSSEFEAIALSGWHSKAWEAAFTQLPASSRTDFSDMVGLLHVLGVEKSEVSSVNSFGRKIIR